MRVLRGLVAAVYALSSTTALSAEGVGQARSVVDVAQAQSQKGVRPLAVGADIYLGELIKTDQVGQAQLLFKDGTRMVVGPDSALVIEQFLFHAGSTENKVSVQALGGAFRFISGEAGSAAYSIRTPNGTIGVRGTAIDFTVVPGDTKMIVLEGGARLCDDEAKTQSDDDEDCVAAATPCAVLHADEDDDKDRVEEIGVDQNRQKVINETFPYVSDDKGLEPDFQIAGHGCAQGGLANTVISGSSVPTEAIIVGGLVILDGVVIGVLLKGVPNNKTND